jgi:alkylated DNA repair dioxygenase AlkB
MLMVDNLLHNILPRDGEVFYYPDFFSKLESSHLFISLQGQVNWTQSPIKMFGKEVLQPRLTSWYGDSGVTYSYSGLSMESQVWTKDLLFIKSKIEESQNVKLNGVLLNRYRDEKDSMGWHRDNEKELGRNPFISQELLNLGTLRTRN